MSMRYKGAVLSATAPTTSNSSAQGIWTMRQQLQAVGGTGWPYQLKFDTTRILIPYASGNYTMNFNLYNWDTNTLTSLGVQNQFYPAGGGGSGTCNILLDPSGNYWALGSNANTGTVYKNFMYLASGSTTPNYLLVDPKAYATYGSQFSQITWNPDLSRIECFTYPHYNVNDSSCIMTCTSTGVTTTTALGTSPAGWSNPAMALLNTRNVDGTTINGTYMVACGDDNYDASNSFLWYDQAPWTTPSFTKNTTQITANPSKSFAAPYSSTQAIVTCFGNIFFYDASTNTYTNVTTTINSAGNGENVVLGCVQMNSGVYVCFGGTTMKVLKGDPRVSITWATSLTTELSLASRKIITVWGVGETLFVITAATTSPYQWYISQLVFNTNAGTYTATHRTLTGLASNIMSGVVAGFQYFTQ